MKHLISFTERAQFRPFQGPLYVQNIMRFQNNITLISYSNKRYHLTAGTNCQSVCLNYLPDRGNLAVRRDRVAPAEGLSPHVVGGVILFCRAGLGSGVDRTAR